MIDRVGQKSQALAYQRSSGPLGMVNAYVTSRQVIELRCFSTGGSLEMWELPEVIVRFKDGVSPESIRRLFSKFDLEAKQSGHPMRYVLRLRPNEADQIMRFANLLRSNTDVLYAEPNFQFIRPSGGSPPVRPNWPAGNVALPPGSPSDFGLPLQWSLFNRGGPAGSGFKPGADIRLLPVLRPGSFALDANIVRVAVLDFAVDHRHPDLAPNIGRTFNVTNPQNPGAPPEVGFGPETEADHGTAVAGLLGAAANGSGIVGVVPRIRMIPIQFAAFNDDGTTASVSQVNISTALEVAAAENADLAVISWGWITEPGNSTGLVNDVNAAIAKFGKPVFLSAGNDKTSPPDILTGLDYPASAADVLPNVIPVGASTWCDAIKERVNVNCGTGDPSWRSRRPAAGPFLVAPGVSLVTTSTFKKPTAPFDPENYRANFSGTSAAAPLAAGVGALILQKFPGISLTELKQRLIDKSDPLPGNPNFRRLNACKALELPPAQCNP